MTSNVVTHCRPLGIPTLVPVYSDAGCTQRAFLATSAATQFIVDETALCGKPYTFYQVTGELTVPMYWLRTSSCSAMTLPATGHLYTGVAITDPFPLGTAAPGPRRGRLGKLYWTGPDGVRFELADWDHDLHRSCYPFIAADGRFRCLPRQPKLTQGYENIGCVGAMRELASDCYGVPPLDGPYYSSCDEQGWQVTEPTSVPAAFVLDEATCRALPAPSGVYEHGTGSFVVPPATFPELYETIE